MRISFRDSQGVIKAGRAISVAGNNLIVEVDTLPGSLAKSVSRVIAADDCPDQAEFWRVYSAMGGGAIYDEDGDVFDGT